MNSLLQTSPKRYAQIAGLLYFTIAIFGGFSMGYLPSVIKVDGDAAQTAANIIANQGLVRFGVVADMIVFVSEILLSVMLFRLFKPVADSLSLAAAFARIGMAIIIAMNALFDLIPLTLLTNPIYADAFSEQQLHALVILFIDMEQYGVYIWQMFFGVHLVTLGYMVMKSGYFPRILGLMMFVGSFGYTLQTISKVVAPDNLILFWIVAGLLVIVTIGEVSFALWLLIKNINVDNWRSINSVNLGAKS